MRLSKLHIAGFKSFPDRSELGFDDGVTAIVGPNGCGKSNVVDAITWVLGEQSAKSLRGERMEDVIFNGSDARKPTATAEVRLKLTEVAQAAVLADAALPVIDELLDASPLLTRDVEIGRRLYRSGESEYLIDGEVCRLRDVHDLLMDSGLGVKAYSVIEQGKIGQILSSRPAERRMLIEEAAGVTKYKSRRRTAELKLEAAQQNLTRIDDIVFEVEKQRGALKRQAARARRYKHLRDELRTWEQVQFARRHEALQQEIEAAERRSTEARVREAAAAAGVAERETSLERVRLEVTEAESAATAAREQAHARELEVGRRQQQIEFERRQIEDLAEQAARFAVEAEDLEGRRGPSADTLAAQRAAAGEARRALDDIRIAVADRVHDYDRAFAGVQAVEQESDGTRAAVLASGATLSALRQARDHAGVVRDRVAVERERLDLEARELSAEVERAQGERAAAEQALSAARADHARLGEARAHAERDLTARRTARAAITSTLGVRQREAAASEARLRSLEELDASRAAFGDAARLLLADDPAHAARHGAVADHLVVERSYERAVDALLGEHLQYVIVDRPDDVTAAIARLGERNAGRCGFLVLSEVGARPAEPAAPLVVPPGATPLSSIVRPVGPHASAVGRLIGRALVVESFDAARALSHDVSVPVAARTGEVFQGSWLVQAGSRQDVRGILEVRAEIQTIGEDLRRAAAEVAQLMGEQARLDDDILAGEGAAVGLQTDEHEQAKAIVGFDARARRASDELDRSTRRMGVVSTERSRAEEEYGSTERRRDEATAAIEAHETRQREAEGALEGVLSRLQTARDSAESRLRLVTESRAELAALAERVSALDADVLRLEEAGRELEVRIAGRRQEIERTEVRRAELRESILLTDQRLDEDIRIVRDLAVEIRRIDEQLHALRQDFNTGDQDIRAARKALDDVRARVMQLEVARATAAADLTHLSETCFEAVGLSLDEVVVAVAQMEQDGALTFSAEPQASAVSEEDEDAESAEAAGGESEAAGIPSGPDQMIERLRKKIDRLGPVNMMAIEQFDELEARHTFLTTQRKDLLDSIAQTGDAIKKIDVTTRERFTEAFEVINRHFEHTFTTLFGGGRAGLVLIDQENDPESGIDIIAQPPGKRLQNVQLLSGGEKALTAMALMFAVFKHRPSPFCLLDEIDAPLDDANIGRFVEMLQGMQTHTQFILITHNRKTMEIANRLYGVTMEEPGVSKLISLQMN